MVICVCRNIKTSDFDTTEDLINRIMQMDHCCGKCKEYCEFLNRSEKIDIDKDTAI